MLPVDQDQRVVTYHAEPGSASAESLRLLASWTLEAAGGGGTAAPAEGRDAVAGER